MDNSKLVNLIKVLIKEQEEESFKIEPDLAFKIYDIMLEAFKGFVKRFPTKSSFFYYLNDKL